MKRSLVGLVLATSIAGCGNDGGGEGLSKTIGIGGGQISSADGVLTLVILPGTLESDTNLTITASETPPEGFVGVAYRVKPDIDVSIPIEITYRLEDASSLESATIGAIHRRDYEAGSGDWVALSRIDHDELGTAVTAIDEEVALFYGLLDDAIASGTSSGGESGHETGSDTMGSESTGTAGEIPVYSYATDIQPIWEASCADSTACHVDNGYPPNLITNSYDEIVGQTGAATKPFVEPGSADDSYLMHKLDGTHLEDEPVGCGCNGIGGTMPLGSERLDAAVRQMIRDWIDQGAPQ